MARLVLRRGRAKPLWNGHPWIYSGAVARVEGNAASGDVVEVADCDGKLIGRGFFNPASQIVCRMATWRLDETLDDDWILRRIQTAQAVRQRLGLPSPHTNAYRLVNSEGDGLPGLIVDVYGTLVAVQFTALGLKLHEEAVLRAIEALLQPQAIVEVGGQAFADAEGFEVRPGPVRGEARVTTDCCENGLSYEVDLLTGQKTGLYLDQRENRAAFGALSKGARVLDLYCYVGGFALEAARAGAATVTAVDSSARALERARKNAINNRVALECVEADAFHFLEAARPATYDLVVVDPPKFARAHKDLDAALKGYRRLNALGLRSVAQAGLFLTSTCSQLVSEEEFRRVVAAAAVDAKRNVRLLRSTEQAADHCFPPTFSEGRYLKCLLLAVE